MTGLEPATTRPPDVYANQLRYIPLIALSGTFPLESECKITY